mgnify:CR=1 FL=1
MQAVAEALLDPFLKSGGNGPIELGGLGKRLNPELVAQQDHQSLVMAQGSVSIAHRRQTAHNGSMGFLVQGIAGQDPAKGV